MNSFITVIKSYENESVFLFKSIQKIKMKKLNPIFKHEHGFTFLK
jgi:hypothetical protein